MTASPLRHRLAIFLVAMLALAAGWAHADPPSRVARLAYVSGAASFSPGGERDWGRAVVNRPLITGDRLWVDRGSRAELQMGTAAIRLGAETSITLLNLDDRITQMQLTQGTLNIRVRRLDRGEVFEVDTPNLAYSIRRPGNYRIEVDSDGRVTTVTARAGLAEVYGEGRAFVTLERRSYRFYDTRLRDYEVFGNLAFDDLDRWATQRDRRWDNSPSRRYVSAEIIGYEDLDQNGIWRKVANYGNVWVPNRVPAGWAPYREGHWAWVEPWGWTWVDDAPWGFAPSHYGRWAFADRTWVWVPGPANTRPVYAPALVAFVSGGGGNNIGWFPLGPREVYRPSYSTSREYFDRVNTSNTVVDRTVITNVYSNRTTNNVTYVNQQVPGAVIAMLAAAFSQSRPVARESVRVTQESFARAPVTAVAPVAPVHASVVAAPSNTKPPETAVTRPVVAQVAPPPPPVPFAAKQRELAANAGKPLEPAAIAALKPAASAPAPAVKVVEATKPIAAPSAPAAPASGRAPRASAPSNAAPASSAPAAAPPSAPPSAPAAAAAPSAPTAASAPAAAAPASRPTLPQRPASQAASRAAPPPAASAPTAAPQAAPQTAPPPAAQEERARGRPEPSEERGRGRRASAPAAPAAPEAARPTPPAAASAPAPAAAPPAPEAPPARTRPAPPSQASPAARPTPPPPAAPAPAPAPAREAPASVPVAPAPPAARPALPPPSPMATPPARAPSAAASAAEERGGRARGPEARASARREAASDEKRRGRGEEERKP
jgi:hypothetical protein